MNGTQRLLLLVLAALAIPVRSAAQETDDPYLWLEEVEGERAMAWVREQSDATLAALRERSVYDSIYAAALEILESQDKIDYPTIRGDRIYNFWQDAEHERGIWRRTTVESYLSSEPAWETVLDIDALAEEEDVPWAFQGAECLAPENRRCPGEPLPRGIGRFRGAGVRPGDHWRSSRAGSSCRRPRAAWPGAIPTPFS